MEQQTALTDLESQILNKLSGNGLSARYLCDWLRNNKGQDKPLTILRGLVERSLVRYDRDASGVLIYKKN